MSSYIGKVTGQGQVSVPAEFRKDLAIEPGTTIEWTREGERLIMQRRKVYTNDDIRAFLKSRGKLVHRTDAETEASITAGLKEKYGSRR